MKTQIKQYKNGLRLAVTTMEGFESVAFNIYVTTGSNNETEGYYGISHYIEHMLFKGTKNRNAYQIAKELDCLGANVNAWTSNDETTYFTKSANENLEKCVEILSDMFFNSVFDAKEMAREKKVVCEEIAMYNDDAYSQSELLVNSIFYNGTNYAKDVAGTKQSVRRLTRQKIHEYMQKYYIPQNVIISFSGNITLKQAENLVEKYFLNQYGLSLKDEVEVSKFEMPKMLKTNIQTKTIKQYKKNEQAHICIEYKGMTSYDEKIYALDVLNTALAGGMSSKLFQRIREQLGLVYSITAKKSLNNAGGDITIHFATSTKNAPLALSAIYDELQKLIKNGLTENEFNDAKNSIISYAKVSYESTSGVNFVVCKQIENHGRRIEKEEILEKYNAVTLEDVNKLFKQLFDTNDYCISYVGENTKIDLLKNYQS